MLMILKFRFGVFRVSRSDAGQVLLEVDDRQSVYQSVVLSNDEAFDLSTHLMSLAMGPGVLPGRRRSSDQDV